jgi:ethanolaminephosphotransferase
MVSGTDFKYRYLSKDGIQALKDFQYNGADNSLIYKYILSPLAGFLVDNATPSTIAPNAITLFGFSFMIISFMLMASHCPTLDHCGPQNNEIPSYIFLFNGVATLVYQTLDNMDGKQARKTGSSSPLGLLFDHGLDAWNVIVGTVNTLCILAIASNDFFCLAAVSFSTAAAFYVATWEEYHTHKMLLPIINGPTEGVLVTAALSFTSWWKGRQFWHEFGLYDGLYEFVEPFLPMAVKSFVEEHLVTGMANKDLLCVFLAVMAVREVAAKILFVVRKYGLKSLTGLIPLSSLMIMSVLILRTNPQVFFENQRTSLLLFGVIFVEMTTGLMLDHMTRSKFDPFRTTLVPIFILYSILDLKLLSADQISLYMMICTCGISSYMILKTKITIAEICNCLGIFVFDIVTPHPNNKKTQ